MAQTGIGIALLLGAALIIPELPPNVQSRSPPAAAVQKAMVNSEMRPNFADFGALKPSADARHLADWIADSHNNTDLDFFILDKKNAQLYAFDQQARLRGSSPVLLGAAVGDDTVPGIGSRAIDQIRPQERTTAAGRFLGERGRNARGEDVVWLDYDSGLSMHRVLVTNPQERRLERLASASTADNRISWGCINVPAAFFDNVVRTPFASRRALIYVLPEVKPVQQVFSSYDVGARFLAGSSGNVSAR